jgi:hypothetical protein
VPTPTASVPRREVDGVARRTPGEEILWRRFGGGVNPFGTADVFD